FYYSITKMEEKTINIEYKLIKKRLYKNHEKVGKLIIKQGDKKIKDINVYVEKTKKAKKLFERLVNND
ncbi:MAG: hypothetical protein RSB72_02150, partial [Bacilli bacterium]